MGTDQVAPQTPKPRRPRMSINDFMVALWTTLSDGEGGALDMYHDQWWVFKVVCWCQGENDAHEFRRVSRGILDVEETLYELHEVMEQAHA